MKKMIGFFVLIALLCVVCLNKTDNFAHFYNCDKLLIVSLTEESEDEHIKSGNVFYYEYESDFKNHIQNMKAQTIGYNFYFSSLNFDKFSKNFDYIYQGETFEQSYQIYYGFYSGYNDFRYIEGKKVNFQLVNTGDEWILGFPMILTGY